MTNSDKVMRRLRCNCTSEFQDQHYGKGIRLCNPMGKAEGYYRCTVCGAEHHVSSATKAEEKPKGKEKKK
jgi:hypothetical protein